MIEKTLILSPEEGNPISLQYMPSVLRQSETSPINTINGVYNSVTFLPGKDNTNKELSITTYFTALSDVRNELTETASTALNAGLAVVGAVGASVAAQTGGSNALAVYSSVGAGASKTIGLAKGAYDVISGKLEYKSAFTSALLGGENNNKKLERIYKCFREHIKLQIDWDIDGVIDKKSRFYYIKNIAATAEEMSKKDTTFLRLDISFIKAGIGIKIV